RTGCWRSSPTPPTARTACVPPPIPTPCWCWPKARADTPPATWSRCCRTDAALRAGAGRARDNVRMAIEELTPREAFRRARNGARLIDVREDHERAAGMAEGARGVACAVLEDAPAAHIPGSADEVILICQTGRRSGRAAEALAALGYAKVTSVAGGTSRWLAEGLPMSGPAAGFDADFHERYSRHLLLPEIGPEGQKRLEAARVLLLGAGGLGSPAAYYLAAAGVGTLRIAD